MSMLRTQVFQAITDAIDSGAEQANYHDSREVDRLADAVIAVLAIAAAAPVARVNDQFSRDGYNDEIDSFLPVGTRLYAAPIGAARQPVTSAAAEVLAERSRQIESEGCTLDHDNGYQGGELSRAAACYALTADSQELDGAPPEWPWPAAWWKPTTERRNLIKAGALILAEIERLDRAGAKKANRE
jgi:hypothetical protein